MPRRLRYALAAPVLLALAACAEDAPLDSLEPKGQTPGTSTTS